MKLPSSAATDNYENAQGRERERGRGRVGGEERAIEEERERNAGSEGECSEASASGNHWGPLI